MTSTLALKPDWAPAIWRTANDIYIQFPDGLVQRFAFTEAGLSRAIKLIPKAEDQAGFLSGGSNIATKLLKKKQIKVARKTRERREVQQLSEDEQARIKNLIRKSWGNG